MAELSSWPIDAASHSFLATSALYAVKSELAIRELESQVFREEKPSYIMLGQTKIFTDYYINNSFPLPSTTTAQHIETKHYCFPQWANHSFVLRIKPWIEGVFMILSPDKIKSLHEQDLIRLIDGSCYLMISFFSNRDILLATSYPLHKHLERRWDLIR